MTRLLVFLLDGIIDDHGGNFVGLNCPVGTLCRSSSISIIDVHPVTSQEEGHRSLALD